MPHSGPPRVSLNTSHTDDLSYTENPFASTHSLDTNPFDDPSPKTAASSTSKVDSARLEDLERRERDLERRETELTQRAEYIRKHGRNNWPPCTSRTPVTLRFPCLTAAHSLVYPLIFHSISEEIPDASQSLILRLYQLWLLLVAVLVVNVVACIVMLASGVSGGGSDLGSGIGCVRGPSLPVLVLTVPQVPHHHSPVGLPAMVPVIITLDLSHYFLLTRS